MSGVTEREALLNALRDQRNRVLRAVAGLPDAALRQPVLRSGRTCLGLVQHLALDVERFWFRAVLAGEAVDLCSEGEAWRVDSATPASAVLDTYREDLREADRVLHRMNSMGSQHGGPQRSSPTCRCETSARPSWRCSWRRPANAGHLDAVRELLDGHQDLVLT